MSEFSDNESVVSVGSGDSAPDDFVFLIVSLAGTSVNVSDSLSAVEAGILSVVNTFDSQKGLFRMLSFL